MKPRFPAIESYQQLENRLRNWCCGPEPEQYDFVGLMNLFRACVENLSENSFDAQLEDYLEIAPLSAQEKAFLTKLTA